MSPVFCTQSTISQSFTAVCFAICIKTLTESQRFALSQIFCSERIVTPGLASITGTNNIPPVRGYRRNQSWHPDNPVVERRPGRRDEPVQGLEQPRRETGLRRERIAECSSAKGRLLHSVLGIAKIPKLRYAVRAEWR